ncbi:MAG: aspartyl/glutamyl-tRNA amidotransferase subunit C [Ruminococcus sp.]|nr:aspartyl/glutamyl-tRNA amidotransferase subunit C [Ruminococcus sp.]
MISKQELENIALLSKLYVPQENLETVCRDMQRMVDFASRLCEAPLSTETETDSRGLTPLREDIVNPSCPREDILLNAPCQESGCFLLRKKV